MHLMTWTTSRLLSVLLLIATSILFAFAPGRGTWVIDPDAAAYVDLARSLATGDGYELAGVPHAKFPPGFPAILSLPMAASGDSTAYGPLRDVVALGGWLTILLSFPLARVVLALGPLGSLLISIATATSIFLLQYSVAFLRSETWFTTFFFLALILGEKWRTERGARWAIGTGLCVGAATFIRTVGIVAIPAIALARAIELRPFKLRLSRRDLLEIALFAVVAIAPTALFMARNHALPAEQKSSSYLDELLAPYALDLTKDVDLGIERITPFGPEMRQRVQTNLAVLALSLGKFATNHHKGANIAVDPRSPPTAPRMRPTGWGLLVVLGLGLIIAAWRNRVMVVIPVAAYIALYLIWPFNQQQRFYMPIQPILLMLLAIGAAPFVRLGGRVLADRRARWLAPILAVALTLLIAAGRSDHPTVLGRYSKEYALLLAAAAGAAIAAGGFAIRWRGENLDAARVGTHCEQLALAAIVLLWFGGAGQFGRELLADDRAFTAQRASEKVDPRFEKIRANPALIEIFQILLDRAEPGDVVMSDIPKIIHVATGLPTTPARVNTREGTVFLTTPDGRPVRFIYVSRELPIIYETFRRNEDKFDVIHEVLSVEGDVSIPIRLYEVKNR